MEKEIKYNGFTATPDDYICPDGDLAAMAGLIPEHAALHPVLPPKVLFTLPENYTVMTLHVTSKFKHYIVMDAGGVLRWLDNDGNAPTGDNRIYSSASTVIKVEAIGNTLVILAEDGLHYILWKDGTYKNLGQTIPQADLSFSLKNGYAYVTSEQILDNSTYNSDSSPNYITNNDELEGEAKDKYNNILLGCINKLNAKEVTGKGRFNQPFFVRYAVRLYDENLVMHSNPVLMLPDGISCSLIAASGGGSNGNKVSVSSGADQLECQLLAASTFGDWKDLIASIDIFISAPLWIYNQAGTVDRIKGDYYDVKKVVYYPTNEQYKVDDGADRAHGITVIPNNVTYPQHDAETWAQKVRDCAQFYLLKSIKVEDLEKYRTRQVIDIADDYLPSLVTREAMVDDYFSHDILIPQHAYKYNGRLNIANIIRRIYKGCYPGSAFCLTNDGAEANVTIYVDIVRDGTTVTVRSNVAPTRKFNHKGLVYYFYPDPMAKRAVIKVGSNCYELPLTPHVGLNGAYWFDIDGLPTTTVTEPVMTNPDQQIVNEPNKIYLSAVNNPFFFPVTGRDTIGAGEIRGICSAVRPVSTAQYGYAKLYIFADNGIWTADVTKEGTYAGITLATEDVCTDAGSITQMETSVLFVTARGIMLISGSQAQCISEVIDSRDAFKLSSLPNHQALVSVMTSGVSPALTMLPFKQFLNGARFLYDYVHQRIVVFNKQRPYAYMYSLESHKWGMVVCDYQYGINAYPDAVAVDADNRLLNLCDEDEVEGVPFVLITRPLKFDLPDVLKTVNTIIQRGEFDREDVKTVLYASRDLNHWHLVHSSVDHYLRGFSGTPYKYFRIVAFGALAPDEYITGASIMLEPRQTNIIR